MCFASYRVHESGYTTGPDPMGGPLLFAGAAAVGPGVLLNGGQVLVAHNVEERGPGGGDRGLAVPSRQLSLELWKIRSVTGRSDTYNTVHLTVQSPPTSMRDEVIFED
jgi:hypothetical protein